MSSPVQALLRLKSSDGTKLESAKPSANNLNSSRKALESSANSAADDSNTPTKPLRPLSAYHVFFQLEREYILQSMAGDDAESNMQEHKILLMNAPKRYASIKVFPDWHARPGKRQRRKHRKSHGQIGFQELSKTISQRWAEIDRTDPDVKSFVQKIASIELEEYQQDMKTYKELTKHLPQETKKAGKASKASKPAASETRTSPSLVSQDGKVPEGKNQVAAAAMLLMQVSVDKCHICKKEGELIACELCSKLYHAACLDLSADEIPVQWRCSACSSSPVKARSSTKRRKGQ
eukprot:CAMPEP_0201713666 /NCGR_PEP_ID=MMETSP0593-20130828/422_1 /ASSEMBLY_ACC=CAM_ASM_000672 /TAXON_ID=267983 /ORGANISM="Skeletonema japonicum, Strain CCMP2506" /LENGTH=291 /DNA_ID=CAMNT_0048202841 /DNA_START=154 /DNA_END=1029 /DNA_ORIENTATION=+